MNKDFKELFRINNVADEIKFDELYSVKNLSLAAVIAAVYVVLTVINPLSYGAVQFRISEALTVLPMMFPQAIPGLFVGVLISNIFSQAGVYDIIFGSTATLIAGYFTYIYRKNMLIAFLSPVIVNAVIVGILLSAVFVLPLVPTMLSVGFGQLVVVFILGYLLIKALDKFNLSKLK